LLTEKQNPPVTWPTDTEIREFTGLWWVAHTRSRNEKALAQDLSSKNISYFLPMAWRIRRHRGRTLRSLLPLFSGYLFFCGDENQRIEVLKTNRVANLIEVKDQDLLVDELSQIEHALRAGAALAPHKYIKAGRRCRVIAGALTGLEGIVVRTQSATRLLLQVDILGRATSVEINAEMLEVIE